MTIGTNEASFERWRACGDGAALSNVFDALAPGLLRLAIHLVGDPAAAEDLLQQTFVTAMEHAASWDGQRALEPWLQGILANHARDLRKSARLAHDQDFDLELALARDAETPLDVASRRELSREIARAVDALEEPYRAAVLLRLRHGMDAADIAHVLGRSPGAVRVQLHRARELLRKSLPAGIASALVLLVDSARGLDAVRTDVLGQAARLAPRFAASGGVLGGVLVMKKLVAVAVLLVLALTAFLTLRRDSDPAVESRSASNDSVESESLARTRAIEAPRPVPQDVRQAQLAEHVDIAAATNEHLRGIVIDALTNAPIAGARIALHAPVPMRQSAIRSRYWDRVQHSSRGTVPLNPWPVLSRAPTAEELVDLEDVLVEIAPDVGATPVAETTTGTDGRFDLSVISADGFVVCAAAGYVERGFATRADRGEGVDAASDRTIRMAINRSMRGRIVAADGSPIRALIALAFYGNTPKMLHRRGGPAVELNERRVTFRTDDEGRYEIEHDIGLGMADSLDARWRVVGYARPTPDGVGRRRTFWADLTDETGDVDIVLAPRLSILVRDAQTRAPIEDAYVEVQVASSVWPVMLGWFHLHDGRLGLDPDAMSQRIAGDVVYGSESECCVWTPGYAGSRVRIASLLAPGVVEIDLARSNSGPIAGRVHRGPNAAAGARIIAYRSQGSVIARTETNLAPFTGAITNAEGQFELAAPDGPYVLTIEHERTRVRRALDMPCTGSLDVDLAVSASLVARVTQSDGAPKPARLVRAVDALGLETRGASDAQGIARLENLAAGTYRVAVSRESRSESFTALETRTIELAPGANEIAFVVPGGRAMYARLVVAHGSARGWTVRRGLYEGAPAPVDLDGRVPMDFSEKRSFLLASPSGARIWVLMPSEAVDGAEVRVRVGGSGYRGRLIDDVSGAPLAGVGLWFSSTTGSDGVTTMVDCDADGRFEVRGLTAGMWSARTVVALEKSDTLRGEVTFELDTAPADPPSELLLRRPPFVDGAYAGHPTVTFEGRFPTDAKVAIGELAYISASAPGDGYTTWMSYSARILIDGTCRARLPSAGEWLLGVWAGDPRRKIVDERWRPSGADPEVRTLTLLP